MNLVKAISAGALLLISVNAFSADTLESIYKRKLIIQDEKVSGDADSNALRAYENYLRQNPAAGKTAAAKHRLADLRLKGLLNG